jgi:hypothetical protein
MLTPVESPEIGKYDYHELEPDLPERLLIPSPVVETE